MSGPAADIVDRRAFILAHTERLAVPHAPEIALRVASEATDLWQMTEEELGEIGLPPPFWAFAWAGGQALARYILDHRETVAGKSVLDLASGSGLVAIAAAMAGAEHVKAVDIDPFAVDAIALNATGNGVTLEIGRTDLLTGPAPRVDVILAGDVFYEKPMADRVFPWLRAAVDEGALCLVGDPGRAYLPKADLAALATYEVATTRALEDSEVKRTTVWRVSGAAMENAEPPA